MTKKENQNAENRAFNTVVELIREGVFVPGRRLFEPDLSERLEMSRTPLRNALSRLVAEGVLVKERGRKGYLIPALSPTDMRDVFLARAGIEGIAVSTLARICSPSQIEELRAINREEQMLYEITDRTGEQRERYAELNEEFHKKLVELSGNQYCLRCFDACYWRSTLYTMLYADIYCGNKLPEEAVPSWVEHSVLINVLEKHDAEKARKLIEEHIINTFRYRSKPEVCAGK